MPYIILGNRAVDARLKADERETTELMLEIIAVARNHGLRLPREFGLILKQVLYPWYEVYISFSGVVFKKNLHVWSIILPRIYYIPYFIYTICFILFHVF